MKNPPIGGFFVGWVFFLELFRNAVAIHFFIRIGYRLFGGWSISARKEIQAVFFVMSMSNPTYTGNCCPKHGFKVWVKACYNLAEINWWHKKPK